MFLRIFFRGFLGFFRDYGVGYVSGLRDNMVLQAKFRWVFLRAGGAFRREKRAMVSFYTRAGRISGEGATYQRTLRRPVRYSVALPRCLPSVREMLGYSLATRVDDIRGANSEMATSKANQLSMLCVDSAKGLRYLRRNIPFSHFFRGETIRRYRYYIETGARCIGYHTISNEQLSVRNDVDVAFSYCSYRHGGLVYTYHNNNIRAGYRGGRIYGVLNYSRGNFAIDRVCRVKSTGPTVSRVIHSCTDTMVRSAGTMSKGVLVGNRLAMGALCVTRAGSGRLRAARRAVPVGRVIRMRGTSSRDVGVVGLIVSSLTMSTGSSTTKTLHLLSTKTRVHTCARACGDRRVDVIASTCSMGCRVRSGLAPARVQQLSSDFASARLYENELSLSNASAREVLSVSITNVRCGASHMGSRLLVSKTVGIGLLAMDGRGRVSFFRQRFSFRCQHHRRFSNREARFSPFVAIAKSSCVLGSNSALSTHIRVAVSTTIFSMDAMGIVASVAISDREPGGPSRTTLAMCFTSGNRGM